MNNSKKSAFQTPKFQQNADEKRFKERVVGERAGSTTENPWGKREQQRSGQGNEKRDKNRPHFATDKEQTKRRDNRQSVRENTEPRKFQITEETRETTKGEKVKVWLKKTSSSENPKEKKTGPLSPRAPEKIKKNRAEEMKIYGEGACLSLFSQRPESIVRVWATVEMAHKIGEIFSYLATHKKVYHVVDAQELALVSGSEHHGGICMLVKKARPFTLTGYLTVPHQRDCLVLLDGVHNAHNIGGILRTCAFYGVKGVVIDDPELLNSPATMRVAEGGAEYVRVLQTDDVRHALNQLREAGYQIIHTSIDKQAESFAKVRLKNKAVFVLSESSTEALIETGDTVTNLSFTNPLHKNGLNVAVQAGVLLARWVEL